MLSQRDRLVLRDLATRVAEHAASPRMRELSDRWRRHNRLEKVGPLIAVWPEGSWPELLPESRLACEGPLAREWEMELRMRLTHAEFLADDTPLAAVFRVPWQWIDSGYGVEVRRTQDGHRGSYSWTPPFDSFERIPQDLSMRTVGVDEDGTRALAELAEETFDGLLRVEVGGAFWWTLGLTWRAIDLVGLEGLLLGMVEDPDGVHRLMAWLRDEHAQFLDQLEQGGWLTPNTREHPIASGGYGLSDEIPEPPQGERATCANLWGFAESQETVGVSPSMFAEFVLPYQKPLLDRFALNCYGCCEPLDARWEHVSTLPRLRRVSVSPWSDPWRMAEALGDRWIFSRKPNPAHVCVGFDEDAIRRDLRDTLRAARGCVLEVILKDLHTVEGDPTRLSRWVRIAREEAARAGL
ncbi:MAG: hypothetical protein N2109_03375 [Fimbriimonadales bacterium]|nr:hypothetical protein [Fimbriimonadales bacterium]